jgi:LytR_cpsA_psr family
MWLVRVGMLTGRPPGSGRGRRILAWTAGLTVLLLVGVAGTSYAALRHFNGNIHQDHLSGLLGEQYVHTTDRVDHFVLGNFNGLKSVVSALNGVRACIPSPVSDPSIGFSLSAGCHSLCPSQAVNYVIAIYGINPTNNVALMCNPVAMYRFADAVTKSLTIDSQLAGKCHPLKATGGQ